MRLSRGMGAIRPELIKRKDADEPVKVYAEGGETKNWIAGAVKHPGALRKKLGVKEGQTIPAGKLAKAAKQPGTTGRQARLAQTLKGLRK